MLSVRVFEEHSLAARFLCSALQNSGAVSAAQDELNMTNVVSLRNNKFWSTLTYDDNNDKLVSERAAQVEQYFALFDTLGQDSDAYTKASPVGRTKDGLTVSIAFLICVCIDVGCHYVARMLLFGVADGTLQVQSTGGLSDTQMIRDTSAENVYAQGVLKVVALDVLERDALFQQASRDVLAQVGNPQTTTIPPLGGRCPINKMYTNIAQPLGELSSGTFGRIREVTEVIRTAFFERDSWWSVRDMTKYLARHLREAPPTTPSDVSNTFANNILAIVNHFGTLNIAMRLVVLIWFHYGVLQLRPYAKLVWWHEDHLLFRNTLSLSDFTSMVNVLLTGDDHTKIDFSRASFPEYPQFYGKTQQFVVNLAGQLPDLQHRPQGHADLLLPGTMLFTLSLFLRANTPFVLDRIASVVQSVYGNFTEFERTTHPYKMSVLGKVSVTSAMIFFETHSNRVDISKWPRLQALLSMANDTLSRKWLWLQYWDGLVSVVPPSTTFHLIETLKQSKVPLLEWFFRALLVNATEPTPNTTSSLVREQAITTRMLAHNPNSHNWSLREEGSLIDSMIYHQVSIRKSLGVFLNEVIDLIISERRNIDKFTESLLLLRPDTPMQTRQKDIRPYLRTMQSKIDKYLGSVYDNEELFVHAFWNDLNLVPFLSPQARRAVTLIANISTEPSQRKDKKTIAIRKAYLNLLQSLDRVLYDERSGISDGFPVRIVPPFIFDKDNVPSTEEFINVVANGIADGESNPEVTMPLLGELRVLPLYAANASVMAQAGFPSDRALTNAARQAFPQLVNMTSVVRPPAPGRKRERAFTKQMVTESTLKESFLQSL